MEELRRIVVEGSLDRVGSARAQFRAQPPHLSPFLERVNQPESRVRSGFEETRPAGFEPATYGLEVGLENCQEVGKR